MTKINPIIFRLLVKNEWKSKFMENKPIELKNYIFQKVEINNFINLFFNKNGLLINDFAIYYKKCWLNLFINYNIVKILRKKKCFLFKNKKQFKKSKRFRKSKKFNLFELKNYFKRVYLINISKLIKFKFINKIIKINVILKRIHFLKFISFFKRKFITLKQNSFLNNFSHKFLFTLKLFLINNKTSIFITLKHNNKNFYFNRFSKKQKKKLTFKIVKLRKFEKNNQNFKFNLNIVNSSLNLQNKSILISKLLNYYFVNLKTLKTLKFFFKFLKSLLNQIVIKLNNVKNINIFFRGNFNKTPKASKKVLKIGTNTNNLKINNKIDFIQCTFFTDNGTIGNKIFIQY